jgi:hypothetical protein
MNRQKRLVGTGANDSGSRVAVALGQLMIMDGIE